jgi:pimeloyl-ACP methyl ester carboxylesterase
LVCGLVLVAPFVRDGKQNLAQRLTMGLMRIPGLARPLYLSYFPNWEPNKPADFAEHKAKLAANLAEPGRGGVVKAYMLQQTHAEAEARLGKVTAPAMVIMGSGDVDWPDPVAEARWICEQLSAELIILDGAGHHPHVEFPREIADAVVAFQQKIDA